MAYRLNQKHDESGFTHPGKNTGMHREWVEPLDMIDHYKEH